MSLNLCPKPNLVVSLLSVTLMIILKNLIVMFFIGVLKHNNREHLEKKIQSKQHVVATFRPLTQKNDGFSILEHFFGPLYRACIPRWIWFHQKKPRAIRSGKKEYPNGC